MATSPIKAIFFDAAGTLFDVKGSVGEVYVTYAKKYGFPNTADMAHSLNQAFKEALKTMPAPMKGDFSSLFIGVSFMKRDEKFPMHVHIFYSFFALNRRF